MKEKITVQSIRLFERKGFSHTSIQDIVSGMGVTKGTFYYYFSSKEELLMEIHNDYITHLLHRQEQISNQYNTVKEKLVEMIRLLITDITNNGDKARVYFREFRHLAAGNRKNIKQKRAQFRLNMEAVVQEGIDQGDFRTDLRADMVTFGILGMTNWSYNWFEPEGEVSLNELTNIYASTILGGLER